MNAEHVSDMLAIHTLKARYFRYMDTKRWDQYQDLFTEDLLFYMEDSPTPHTDRPITTSRAEFMQIIKRGLGEAVSVHQGMMPEIEILSDTSATGVWAMFDYVDNPVQGRAFHGYGHYHERYEKGADGAWRIKELRLTRIRVDHVVPPRKSPWMPDLEQLRRE